MTASSEKLVLNQFPQPARPSNSYDTSVFDKYEKLPACFRDQINVEEMLRENRKRQVEETQNTTSRGLQQPVQEKLDRFKVRYVSTEDVVTVTDDDKK